MISIVYCTREENKQHQEHLIKSSGLHKHVEVIEIINNGESLTKAYNRGLKQAKNDIVVFCHDDIIIETKQWGKKLEKLFNKNEGYGIIGVAGTKYMSKTGRWWDDRTKMYGKVAHTHEGKTWLSSYSDDLGDRIEETVIVDGVWFAVHKNRLKKDFDESVEGFHFYDVSFCFQNRLEGVKVGVTTKIRINHMSIGQTNDQWEENRKIFAENYKDKLPIKIDREFNGNERFKVLVAAKTIGDTLSLVDKLKKKNYKVTVCTPVSNDINEEINFLKLKSKNVKFIPLNQPPGYRLGDGQWQMQTPNGVVNSEPNKLYRISNVDFDVTHTTDLDVLNHLNKLYPEIPCISIGGEIEDIVGEYQKVLT